MKANQNGGSVHGPAFKPLQTWEGLRRKAKVFKPDPGNLAVREYKGASGNVSHGGTVNPSSNRKSRNGNPPPTAGRARLLSQWGRSSPLDRANRQREEPGSQWKAAAFARWHEPDESRGSRPDVCPVKASVFSRRQTYRGKSQAPRSSDSRVAGKPRL